MHVLCLYDTETTETRKEDVEDSCFVGWEMVADFSAELLASIFEANFPLTL